MRGQCGLRMTVFGTEVGDEAKMMFEIEREFVRNDMENKLRDNIMGKGDGKRKGQSGSTVGVMIDRMDDGGRARWRQS